MVHPALQPEGALRQMKYLFRAVDLAGKQAIIAGVGNRPERLRCTLQHGVEVLSDDTTSLTQQLAGGRVRVGYPLMGIDQYERERGVLSDGVQE